MRRPGSVRTRSLRRRASASTRCAFLTSCSPEETLGSDAGWGTSGVRSSAPRTCAVRNQARSSDERFETSADRSKGGQRALTPPPSAGVEQTEFSGPENKRRDQGTSKSGGHMVDGRVLYGVWQVD